MVLMGHSFGGLILYNAISGAITERLTSLGGRGGTAPPPPWSYGDMVILINPAFEATRYTPLHRIATGIPSYPPYERPLFLAITTRADLATRVFFPLGRYLNTIFERHASSEERLANRRTMGHVPAYLTHALTKADGEPCAGWRDPDSLPAPERPAQMRLNNALEVAHARKFLGNWQSLPPGWVRTFCGGAVLTHHQHDPVSPIWNVQADRGVMNGHSDISNPVISSFLRQLYRDPSGVSAP